MPNLDELLKNDARIIWHKRRYDFDTGDDWLSVDGRRLDPSNPEDVALDKEITERSNRTQGVQFIHLETIDAPDADWLYEERELLVVSYGKPIR